MSPAHHPHGYNRRKKGQQYSDPVHNALVGSKEPELYAKTKSVHGPEAQGTSSGCQGGTLVYIRRHTEGAEMTVLCLSSVLTTLPAP
eukprot:1157076-Pelagomonas_calceolata.AAC.5